MQIHNKYWVTLGTHTSPSMPHLFIHEVEEDQKKEKTKEEDPEVNIHNYN